MIDFAKDAPEQARIRSLLVEAMRLVGGQEIFNRVQAYIEANNLATPLQMAGIYTMGQQFKDAPPFENNAVAVCNAIMYGAFQDFGMPVSAQEPMSVEQRVGMLTLVLNICRQVIGEKAQAYGALAAPALVIPEDEPEP